MLGQEAYGRRGVIVVAPTDNSIGMPSMRTPETTSGLCNGCFHCTATAEAMTVVWEGRIADHLFNWQGAGVSYLLDWVVFDPG